MYTKETDEDLLLGNGDEHPNAADEHIDSDIEMKLLKGDQADYEGGDEGINESKESAQRRKVLKVSYYSKPSSPDETRFHS